MRKVFFVVVFILLLPSPLSGKSFSDLFEDYTYQQDEEGVACPYCEYYNPPNTTYCGACVVQLVSSPSFTVQCPYCFNKFQAIQNTCIKVCPNCGHQNNPDSNYCNRCGISIKNTPLSAQCPYCGRWGTITQPPKGNMIVYPYCHREYPSTYKVCPYYGITQEKKKSQSNSVLLDSFTKPDYEGMVKRYNISSYTSSRGYSKVVIETHITQKYAVIVNTIKIRHGGTWHPFPITTRLHEGRNEFSASIPQNATELVISFDHGQGCEVKVYLE